MTQRDLEAYITSKWGPPNKSVREISMSDDGIPLVDSERLIYCFDDLCKDIYLARSLPTSADGLIFHSKCIELIEFKSGFKDKITKENFNVEDAKCIYKGEICEDYWSMFRKNRKHEKEILIESLRLKAIESYITLEQHLFPECDVFPDKKQRVNLLIVIDAEESDTIEDICACLTL